MERVFEFSFNNREEVFTLPINPTQFELSHPQLNSTITLANIGEINFIGKRGLVTGNLSSFFPSRNSPFASRADYEPMEYVHKILKWKDSGKPFRLIITGSDINLAMSIERFSHFQREGDEDVYYTVELKEYRFLNVPSAFNYDAPVQDNGLKERPDTSTPPKEHIVRDNETLWTVTQKYFGVNNTAAKRMSLAEKNNITNPAKLPTGRRMMLK